MNRTPIATLLHRCFVANLLLPLLAGCGDAGQPVPSASGSGNTSGATTGAAGPGSATGSSQTGSQGSGGDSTVGSGAGGSGGAAPGLDAGAETPDSADAGPLIRVVSDGETTRSILGAQGPNCTSCALMNGCLDPAQNGGACEDTPGTAPAACGPVFGTTSPVTETKVCLATLKMIFSSHCSADLQQQPCFCGDTDRQMCLAGDAPPTGPGVDLYTCDLGAGGITSIVGDYGNQMRGAGQANELVNCLGFIGCECNL